MQAITLVEEEEIWIIPNSAEPSRVYAKKLSDKYWNASKRNFIWYDFCRTHGIPASGQVIVCRNL